MRADAVHKPPGHRFTCRSGTQEGRRVAWQRRGALDRGGVATVFGVEAVEERATIDGVSEIVIGIVSGPQRQTHVRRRRHRQRDRHRVRAGPAVYGVSADMDLTVEIARDAIVEVAKERGVLEMLTIISNETAIGAKPIAVSILLLEAMHLHPESLSRQEFMHN